MDRKRTDVGGKFCLGGKVFLIYGGVNPIGRNKEAVVNIKSLGVSQQHALFILVDDDLHFVSDLKSSNGTFLDNKKLDPLQLYRLENGSRIKFADIEGVYSKLTLNDVERQGNFSILSENTQNFTQNFYGSDTQIMDNTNLVDHRDKSETKNYISTQILAEVADEMENSYIKAHEQPTQVVLSGIEEMLSISKEKNCFNYLNKEKVGAETSNVHEAETQIITDQEIEGNSSNSINENKIASETLYSSKIRLHEVETQVITNLVDTITMQNINSDAETSRESVQNMHEAEPQLTSTVPEIGINNLPVDTTNKVQEQNIQNFSLQNENIIDVNIDNTAELKEGTSKVSMISDSDVKISQDDDVVNPIGLSSNIIKDTQNSFIGLDLSSLDESESEVIRPVKKSINIFDSQESEEIEDDSNDSVDFMTMQKITNTEKYSEENVSRNKIPEKNENIPQNIETDGFKTDNKKLEIDDGSETEDEYIEKLNKNEISKEQNEYTTSNVVKTTHSCLNELQTSNSETDAGNELISDKEINRKKRKTKRAKKKKVISNSDSETDQEFQKKEKSLVKVFSVCSDSDTDIDNVSLNKEKNNESVGLVLEESALEDDPKNSEEKVVNEQIPTNRNTYSMLSVGYNESLNDSDFIPPTQDNNLKTSQNSKCENSENSFTLGLTQLMEEDNTSQPNKLIPTQNDSEGNKDESVTENKKSQSGNSLDTQKKFIFKKSSVGITESADITLDYNEDIYQAQTQNIHEEKNTELNNSNDDHIFLQPTQEAPKKTKHIKESIPDDDFYLLSTQKLDGGSSNKNEVDDFYQQSTQKLIVEESVEQSEETKLLRLSGNEFYQLPTQKISENKETEDIIGKETKDNISKETEDIIGIETEDIIDKKSECKNDYDDDDIFATQVMDMKDSPNKYLESELEHMFATQRAIPTEDTLDKIQDIVLEKQIIDDKLPTEDKDLEAILATQKMLDSPKRSKKNINEMVQSEKSLESQLEVMFASQTCNLPPDKFVRPPNPLVNIFGDTQDTQELLKENSLPDREKQTDEHDESESTVIRQKKTSQVGLEQSFALLEAKSTKIRRSHRNKDCEEVSVSCPKSRVSMTLAPNDKKISEEEPKSIQVKNTRTTRKRQQPTIPESIKMDLKKPEKRKKRRISETTNSSDEENQSNIPAVSSKQSITNKILSRIQEIENEEDMKSSTKRPESPNRKRSSRIQRTKTEENIESTNDVYAKTYKKRISRVNKITDPSTSNNSVKEKDLVKHEGNTKNKSSKSKEENNEFECKNNKKLTEVEEKSSRTRSRMSKISDSNMEDKIEEKESVINEVDNEEEKKTSRARNSRVAKITVEDRKSSAASNNAGISKSISRKVEKANEDSSGSFENVQESGKRGTDKNSVNKLKDIQKEATPSRASKRGCSIQVTTPPKILKVAEATPSSSIRKINVEDTPNRNKRKLKPKVVFTMMDDPQLESQIKQLGGSVIESVDTCTVLITKLVKRTMKLLSAVGLGKPICSEEWVKRSKKENDFLDPWDFVLVDSEAEKKWDFSLKRSLERSLQTKLFEGYTFQLFVTSAQDVLKGAIESCGGKIVTRTPKVANNFVVVATPDQKDKYKKLLKQSNLIVVEPEAIFDGVLRQEIRFERHFLK